MKSFPLCILLAAGLSAHAAAQTGKVDVAPPQARMAAINQVKTLLTTKVVEDSPDTLAAGNPFQRPKPVEKTDGDGPSAKAVEVAAGDRMALLQKIAAGIVPTGTMKLGDSPILLFGQKKFKVGDTLPIIFEGTAYELQITAIERISFTLRLNNEEITRPIKPVTTKP